MRLGFVKLHRKLIDWEWYQCPNTFRLFIHLLLLANHKPNKWQSYDIDRGQVLTGRKVLSSALGITEQQIRTSINKLKSTNDITIKTTNKFSLVTVVNYSSYQDCDSIVTSKTTSDITNEQPTSNQQVTTNKNDKNVKNENKTNKAAMLTHEDLPDYIDASLFGEFLEVRRKLKAVNTERAIKLLIGKLQEFHKSGRDPNKAIERSIENSWKTVYPEKSNETNQSNSGNRKQSNLAWLSARIQEDIKNEV